MHPSNTVHQELPKQYLQFSSLREALLFLHRVKKLQTIYLQALNSAVQFSVLQDHGKQQKLEASYSQPILQGNWKRKYCEFKGLGADGKLGIYLNYLRNLQNNFSVG